jgi:cardiolipin synthase
MTVIAIVLLALLALVGVLHVVRGTPVSRVVDMDGGRGPIAVDDECFLQVMELFASTRLEGGHRTQLLANGDGIYPPLWRDIAAAAETVDVQMYYAKPGVVADTMARHLADRARAGARVRLILDAFGTSSLADEWRQRLRDAGVRVVELRPLRWQSLHTAGNRSHVRAVIVDGRVGYTGGFGLADYWLGDGRHDGQWREMGVRFEGPAVAHLHAAFAVSWAEATGELVATALAARNGTAGDGGVVAGFLHATPTAGSTNAERFLALSITAARKTFYAANSYFSPDDDFRRLLKDAVRRGVDVRVITTGPKSDVRTTYYAGRARYEELLEGGVRIYEYQPTMMHAKTIVVDGVWCTVGSLNFDNRSLAHNNESNLLMLDGGVGAEMEAMFHDDLGHCVEITLEAWRARPWTTRILEVAANPASRLL